MNDLTTTQNETLPAPVSAANAYAAAGSELAGDALPLLKLSKAGELVTGTENEPVTETRFAADVQGAQQGFVCFVDGRVVDEALVLVATGKKIEEDELPDHGPYQEGDGWARSATIHLRSIETGEEFAFKPTSLGGRAAIGALFTKYGYRLNIDKAGVPIIDLNVSSYQHPKYGKVYKPHFKIVSWQDEADLVSGASAEPDDEPFDDDVPF